MASSWKEKKKKKKNTQPFRKVVVSVPRRLFFCLLLFSIPCPETDPCSIFDSAIRSLRPRREGRGSPHLRPAAPPPAKNPLLNRRLSRVVVRRHHSGPWFLWFRWYWNDKGDSTFKVYGERAALETVVSVGFHPQLELLSERQWRVSWDEGEEKKKKTTPDTGTVLIFSQQSASVTNRIHKQTGLPGWTDSPTHKHIHHKSHHQTPTPPPRPPAPSLQETIPGLCAIRRSVPSEPLRSWDKIIAPNGIRELPTTDTHSPWTTLQVQWCSGVRIVLQWDWRVPFGSTYIQTRLTNSQFPTPSKKNPLKKVFNHSHQNVNFWF